MIEFPTLQTLTMLAWCIRRMTREEGAPSRQALSWVARNRVQKAVRAQLQLLALMPETGGALLGTSSDSGKRALCALLRDYFEAGGDIPAAETLCRDPELLAQADFMKALAALCQCWCAAADQDPTLGADLFHHHGAAPAWAGELSPTALIESRFYYRTS